MTLPSSGVITLEDIQGEFGGPTSPISLFNYYRGGSYVPNITQNNGIPTSGAISLFDFYDGQNVTITAPSGTAENFGSSGILLIEFTINPNGTTTVSGIGGSPTGDEPNWCNPVIPGIGSDYQVRAVQTNAAFNVPPAGSPLNTWLSLNSSPVWQTTHQDQPGSNVSRVDLRFDIRLGTGPIISQGNYILASGKI